MAVAKAPLSAEHHAADRHVATRVGKHTGRGEAEVRSDRSRGYPERHHTSSRAPASSSTIGATITGSHFSDLAKWVVTWSKD